MIKVSVIVPSFGRPADLRRCLEAVGRQTRSADEILVVGRESDTATAKVVSILQPGISALRIVLVSAPGLVAALNCGLDNASGDLLLFTDDDAEPQLDWVDRIEMAFADSSVGAVGGRDWLQLPDEPTRFQPNPVSHVGVLNWYGALCGNHHCPVRGHIKRVTFLKGVNMAFRRHALGTYRIDTSLRGTGSQVGSELDLCLHVRKAGLDVLFDDRILVKHFSSPRCEDDDRNQLSGPVFEDICFNNHYMVAKRFGLYRALAYLCNERFLGSRAMPGLLACFKWHFKGDRLVWKRSLSIASIAMAGFRAGRQSRAFARQTAVALDRKYSSPQLNA